MRTLLLFSEHAIDLARPWPSHASDVASSLARIDIQLGRDGEEEPDPLRPPSSRGRRVWCSEE